MREILGHLGLEKQIFECVPDTIPLDQVCYAEVDNKIEYYRKISLDYLSNNLDMAYGEYLNKEHSG